MTEERQKIYKRIHIRNSDLYFSIYHRYSFEQVLRSDITGGQTDGQTDEQTYIFSIFVYLC